VDTIPIESLVQQVKARAIALGTNFVIAEIVAFTGPISGFFAPLINWLLKEVVEYVVTIIVNKSDKFLFGVNMALITTDQAKDYRDAEAKVLSLPDDVSDADWEAAELAANHAFDNLAKLAS
jgi:hypothetical protein